MVQMRFAFLDREMCLWALEIRAAKKLFLPFQEKFLVGIIWPLWMCEKTTLEKFYV